VIAWWLWAGCVLSVSGYTEFGEPIDRVVIDVARSNVQVVGSPGPVFIDVDVGGWSDGDVRTMVDRGVLFVDYACGQSEWCGGDLYVEIPPSTPAQVSLQSGDLRVRDVSAEVIANLREGRFTVNDHGPGPVVVAANGTVDLGFAAVPSRVDVETTDGDVRLVGPSGSYALDFEATEVLRAEGIVDDPESGRVLRVRTPDTIRLGTRD